MTDEQRSLFTETVWQYYARHGRAMPWREPAADGQFDPYKILVSELMLQQTQVSRVVPKFAEYIARFPTVSSLAAAPLSEVLAAWNGLGYNRRAKYLHQAAQAIAANPSGFPRQRAELEALPGVGPNTAGAILAYAFNQPVSFIETNIRTVYIHHFFNDAVAVSDKALLPLLAVTIDQNSPREWYWALMDYGAYLKQTVGNLTRLSQSYTRQSTFQGSRRQLRGQILRELLNGPKRSTDLQATIQDDRLAVVLEELVVEQLISQNQGYYRLGSG